MKKFLTFLSTTLSEKRETTVGYRIYTLIVILMLLFGGVAIFSRYVSYKTYIEEYERAYIEKLETSFGSYKRDV